MQIIYGLFRTKKLRESMITKPFVGVDHALLLNILHYGNISVIDKNLISIYDAGLSKKGIISLSKQFNKGAFGIIFCKFFLYDQPLQQRLSSFLLQIQNNSVISNTRPIKW